MARNAHAVALGSLEKEDKMNTCGTCGRETLPDGDCYGCEADRKHAQILRLEGLIARVVRCSGDALVMLTRLEWSHFDADRRDMYCIACRNTHDEGHTEDCVLPNTLKALRGSISEYAKEAK